MRQNILPRLAVLVAAAAALLAPVAGPASAAPAAVNCWNEFDFYKVGNTLHATAFKDCVHLDTPQPLSVAIERHVCDEDGSCYWITWRTGTGTVTHTCPGTYVSPFRSSRMRHEVIYC